jgi:hypothetical protein
MKYKNDEFHNFSSLYIVKTIKSRRTMQAGHAARVRETAYTYKIFVGKPHGQMPLWRPRHRMKG